MTENTAATLIAHARSIVARIDTLRGTDLDYGAIDNLEALRVELEQLFRSAS